jgi:small-conductance mechanosensitive channel
MIRKRLKNSRDLHLERMFETRSEAWERVGLALNVSQRAVRRARGEIVVLLPLLIGVLVLYHYRTQILGSRSEKHYDTWIHWGTVLALLALGWTVARDIGRAAGPTFFRRMDPGTAGTVGFLIRLGTMGITLMIALSVAGVKTGSLVAGSAFTAVVLGLAAQQTLGNLIAGVVLLTARPFRVGERIRLQAGALGGVVEGVVSSLGLMYTTIARGEDRVMIPNNGVLSAVIVPLREPDSVDVRVRLSSGVRPSQVQALLDDRISTPTRATATVLLEEIDGENLVVRVKATPERANDGARLADEIIATLASVTGEHEVANRGPRGSDARGTDGKTTDGEGAAPNGQRGTSAEHVPQRFSR